MPRFRLIFGAFHLLGILIIFQVKYSLTNRASISSIRTNYGLNGVHLKFGVYNVPPFAVLALQPDGNYTHVGNSRETCQWLKTRLNFTYSNVVLNETAINKYGTGNGLLINLLTKGEVDGTAIGLIATPERKEKVDFPAFMWIESYSMVVPKSGEEPRLLAFIMPFQPTVWLFILISMLTMMSFMTVFLKTYSLSAIYTSFGVNRSHRSTDRKRTVFEYASVCMIYIVNTMTKQGGTDFAIHMSFRILVGVWLLIAMVLVNSYSGTVISYLTVPKMKPHINTFEDLAANQEVGIVLLEDAIISEQILGAKSGVLKILGDQARQNPKRILPVIGDVTKRLQEESFAFPYLQTFSKFFIANSFKRDGNCRFQITDPLPIVGVWSFALQKNSKFTPDFNKALIEIWETGLNVFWVTNSVPSAPKCFAKIRPEAELRRLRPIKLKDVIGIFMILGIGIVLSTCVFFFEILKH